MLQDFLFTSRIVWNEDWVDIVEMSVASNSTYRRTLLFVI